MNIKRGFERLGMDVLLQGSKFVVGVMIPMIDQKFVFDDPDEELMTSDD